MKPDTSDHNQRYKYRKTDSSERELTQQSVLLLRGMQDKNIEKVKSEENSLERG